ncbi:MAG: formate dehydrogenase accessory protein FdhE [Chloroflexi bacterium]|nr:MAG: formate dehydrogenase accessory protein FdhE [Chloroflexota bacterium]
MRLLTRTDPWTEHRRRATELGTAEPHAAEILRLYLALLDVWSESAGPIRAAPPAAAELPAFAVRTLLPGVLGATLAAGPLALRESVLRRFEEADLADLVACWLAGAELPPVDRYLARAAAAPILELVPDLARATGSTGRDSRHCPACGGLPQLAYFGKSEEALVTAPRRLVCSRCSESWIYPRMICAGCGNPDTTGLPVYSDAERFPGLRIDACEVCRTYLVTVDLPKDPAAEPVVDELAALPLDLFARERGFTKITPNLVGF